MRHHALREQAGERLGQVDHADVRERAGPEAGVEQVQDRVLDPADVLLDRQPLGDLGPVERLVGRLAGEAQEVPAELTKVSSVSVSRSRRAAAAAGSRRASRSDGARAGCPGSAKSTSSGRTTGSWSFGHRHHAAGGAVDERDRRAPVALARDAPVAQAPDGLALAPAFGSRRGAITARLGVGDAHAVEEVRIDQHAVARFGLASAARRPRRPLAATTREIGRPYLVANSKSRWSCPGTAMIAPVP